MIPLFKLLSWLGLAATVVPCLLFYFDATELETVKTVTLLGTILWFIATPLWMGRGSAPATMEETTK